jgi:hypothetical protein
MKIMRFQGSFGSGPKTLSDVFIQLQTTNIEKARINKPDLVLYLATINWLKTNATETALAMAFKRDEKTIRSAKWKYTYAIQALKEEKVSTAEKKHACISSKSYVHTILQIAMPDLD